MAFFGRIRSLLRIHRAIGVGLLALASLATMGVVTLGFERLFSRRTGQWIPAVQASSTLVLIIVTAIYVFLTAEILNVQRRPVLSIRLAAQQAAVSEAITALTLCGKELFHLARSFPVETVSPNAWTHRSIAWIASAKDNLESLSYRLPADLADHSLPLCLLLAQVLLHLTYIEAAITHCLNVGKETLGSPPDWACVRRSYYSEVRPLRDERPEWEDLDQGTKVTAAHDAAQAFLIAAAKYLIPEADER